MNMPSPSLAGLWQPLYAELGGEKAPKMMLEKMEIELTDSQYDARFASPTWHRTALLETPRLVKAGKAKFSDWDDTKARLRRKIAKVA